MRFLTRLAPALCIATLALAACDPAEFDADPEVRSQARGERKCLTAVTAQTGVSAVAINTTLPIVEVNQIIVDVTTNQTNWMCRTDDLGEPQTLYQMGQG